MKGVAEDIYQDLLTREINDTASFIKWCNYIEDMKQKRVGRPRFERLPNVVPVASLTMRLIWSLLFAQSNSHLNQENRCVEKRLPPDNRPVCFHCGRPGHVMRYCRERKAVFDNFETADGTSTTLALKKKYADQTLLAVLRQVPREADPQYVVTDPRRHIADPVSRQAVGARKTKQSDLPRR
ncbi:CCHC-type domain-containing protein [Trichonephila clavipes]|nr:CCHC-type domain-containing protein [Trichonephila clavipes]